MTENRADKVLAKVGLKAGAEAAVLPEASQLKAVCAAQNTLLGSGPSADAEISQWLSFAQYPFDKVRCEKLNNFLLSRSYLVSNQLTIADASVFVTVQDNFETSGAASFPAVTRWFNHIQGRTVNLSQTTVPAVSATVFPVSLFATSSSSVVGASKETATANDAPSVPPVATETAAKEEKKTEGNSKKDKKAEKSKDAAAPAAEKKGDTPPTVLELDPSRLDIRVGLVVKCWNHPESDKLLCEEIDLGEGTNRSIASGLRAHYTAEEVQGRKVVVIANLKERPMAGFKSQGMVLCAVSGNHDVVKLLAPPADAQIGERVTFPGFSGEPFPANQVAKKKILEGLAPQLRTDESGVAHWSTSPFTLASGVCKSELSNAIVS